MAVSQNFPSIAPSLTLNFASSRTLDPRITFTRTTTATCVGPNGLLKTVPADAPRFDHDPTTGESLGLLVEESRTNLLLQSERIDQSPWTLTLSSAVAETTALPNGDTSAYKLVPDLGTGAGLCRQNPTLTDNTVYTISIFAKAAGFSQFFIQLFDKAGTFAQSRTINLLTGDLIGSETGSSVTSVVDFGNGWYRIILANVNSLSGGTTPNVRFRIAGTGDGTSGIYFWGAQLEAGSFPTSYIPTEGTTVTRAADLASISGNNFSSWYNQSEGTVFADVARTYGNILGFSDGGAPAERFRLGASSSAMVAFGSSGGSTQFNINSGAGTWISPAAGKGALALKVNDFAASANGNPVQLDLSGVIPSVDRLLIGTAHIDNKVNGSIKRITYWPQRLPDSTLQTITN